MRTAAILAGALACGCTVVRVDRGQPLAPELADRVKPGDARGRVLEVLGAPERVERAPGGSRYVYRYYSEEADHVQISLLQASAEFATDEARTDRLVVRFDHQGRVTSVARPVGVK